MTNHVGFFRGQSYIRNYLSAKGNNWHRIHAATASRALATHGGENGEGGQSLTGDGDASSAGRFDSPADLHADARTGLAESDAGEEWRVPPGGENGPSAEGAERQRPLYERMRDGLRKKYGLVREGSTPHYASSQTTQRTPSAKSDVVKDDFFGIYEEQEDKEASSSETQTRRKALRIKSNNYRNISGRELRKKFNFLEPSRKLDLEKMIEMPYGLVRMDQDNIPQKHGYIYAKREPLCENNDSERSALNVTTIISPNARESSREPNILHQKMSHIVGDNDNHLTDSFKRENNDPLYSFTEAKPKSSQTQESNIFDDQYFGGGERDQSIAAVTLPEKTSQSSQVEETSLKSVFDDQHLKHEEKHAHSETVVELNATITQDSDLHISKSEHERKTEVEAGSEQPQSHGSNVFEDQYFRKSDSFEENDKLSKSQPCISSKEWPSPGVVDKDVVNMFDEQYFQEGLAKSCENPLDILTEPYMDNKQSTAENEDISAKKGKSSKRSLETKFNANELNERDVDSLSNMSKVNIDSPDVKNEYVETITQQQQRLKKTPIPDFENPKSAYDVAMKIRLEQTGRRKSDGSMPQTALPNLVKWTGAVDSKGFRKLKNQVLDIQSLPEDVVLKILKESIIYENDDIVAVDKPYGLPSHGGPGVHHSVGKLSEKLATIISRDIECLNLVHRLDKETTGIMVLAKNQEMHRRLRDMFKKREVVKKYWIITKGIPNPEEGVIDIPMEETQVGSMYRMNLKPYKTEETVAIMKKQRFDSSVKLAITNYKVLDSANDSALVECHPETGVKHQIRCHMSFALNTAILGDHKYSHYSKIVPQRLPPAMLLRLGLRQATVRYVPMHLHAKMLVFPQLYEGRNLFISARLPKHFVQNMKWLKLKPPKGM